LVCNQPLRPTQPSALSGIINEYRPSGTMVVLYDWEGSRRSDVAPAVCHRLCYVHRPAEWTPV